MLGIWIEVTRLALTWMYILDGDKHMKSYSHQKVESNMVSKLWLSDWYKWCGCTCEYEWQYLILNKV